MDSSLLLYENRGELVNLLRAVRAMVNPEGFDRYDFRGIITAPIQEYDRGKVYGTIAKRVRLHYNESGEGIYSAGRLWQREGLALPSSVPDPNMRSTDMVFHHIGLRDFSTIDFVINNFVGDRADREFDRMLERIGRGYKGRFTLIAGYARPTIIKCSADVDTLVQMNRSYVELGVDHAKETIVLNGKNGARIPSSFSMRAAAY